MFLLPILCFSKNIDCFNKIADINLKKRYNIYFPPHFFIYHYISNMKKLTENEVNDLLKEHRCTLVGSYKNNRTKITMLCSCNHERITTLAHWKLLKQYLCKQCTPNIYFKRINNQMHPQKYKSRLKKMNYLLTRNKKYRTDFLPENYNKTIICCVCELEKPIYLFGNNNRKTNGKMFIL